ncbi:MAG: hypothetical protein WBF58_11325 [Xanthobacteraceae bacterium]
MTALTVRSRATMACAVVIVAASVGTIDPAGAATADGVGTAPAPKANASWPARFPRTLFQASDVAAAKANATARPASFNLLPWQTPIKNQQQRDTCYAFAFTAGLEAAYRHKYGKLVGGTYQGPTYILSEEFLIHIGKSTLLNVPRTYLFENPSSYWPGVIGVVGGPMMISVLSEQLMNYRIPETQYAPYLIFDNTAKGVPANTPPGQLQLAQQNDCASVTTLAEKWVSGAPKVNSARQCAAGNCATQQAVDACEYAPDYIPAAASRNARFAVSFSYKAAGGREQPGAKALSQPQMSDTDLIESLLYGGHEVIAELFLKWKRGQQIKTAYQTSPLWNYDATAPADGHNMLVVGYDRSSASPSLWYFIMKNSWGGNKYYFVSYEFMRKAMRGGVIILDVVDPAADKAASLVQGGSWLGIWPVHRSAQSDLDGTLVIRRTFDSNVSVQPKAGTALQLGDYYPSDKSTPQPLTGSFSSDSTLVFKVTPPKPASPVSYTWTFGGVPERL